MIIGIDIDGVLIDDDTYRLDTMAKYCFENNLPEIDEPNKYETKCKWPKGIEEDYRNKYYFEYVRNVPARKFAAEVTKKLHEKGNKIIIVTGRYKTQEDSNIGQQMRNDTVNWLSKNKIIYDKICYAHFPKTNEIKENNIDVMIDDSPKILPELTKTTKVLCFDNRYNRDLQYDNMIRVYSWYDIYEKIRKLNNSNKDRIK